MTYAVRLAFGPESPEGGKSCRIRRVGLTLAFAFALRGRGKQLPWHMVIEGTDQHRCFSQSELLRYALTRNQLAFEPLIVHPFVMFNRIERCQSQGWRRGRTESWAEAT
ncbi:MAG: hypothetical protein ACKESB_01280 [Candidatus Hodgkinia cicadicola]